MKHWEQLRDTLCRELDEIAEKGELSAGDLETVDKLTHTMKNLDKIMIGDIMLLIPGIAMTNAIRDMLMGDTISGLMRLIESILWAGSLAVGFMASIWMVGI